MSPTRYANLNKVPKYPVLVPLTKNQLEKLFPSRKKSPSKQKKSPKKYSPKKKKSPVKPSSPIMLKKCVKSPTRRCRVMRPKPSMSRNCTPPMRDSMVSRPRKEMKYPELIKRIIALKALRKK